MLGCRGLGVRGPDPRPGVPAQQPAGELRGEDEGHGGRHPQAGGAARTRQGQRGVLARPLDRSMEFRGSFHNFREISLTALHSAQQVAVQLVTLVVYFTTSEFE